MESAQEPKITVIVEGKEFKISRDVLQQSEKFKDLLKIDSNNIILEYVSLLKFEVWYEIMENKKDVFKEVIELHEFLGFENRCDFGDKYYCTYVENDEHCNRPLYTKRYCELHKCGVKECLLAIGTGKKFCVRHYCEFLNCDNRGDFNRCSLHKCISTLCPNMQMAYSKYCRSHGCCVFECENKEEGNGFFCKEHSYCSGTCVIESLFNSTCKTHNCDIKKCVDYEKHMLNFCSGNNCKTKGYKSEKVNGSNFCVNCKCAECKSNERIEGIDFCNEHKCEVFSCINGKVNESNYCATHKCHLCDGEAQWKYGHSYCMSHICISQNCGQGKLFEYGEYYSYCAKHKCSLESCDEEIYNNSEYCYKHMPRIRCQKLYCLCLCEPNDNYCFMHKFHH